MYLSSCPEDRSRGVPPASRFSSLNVEGKYSTLQKHPRPPAMTQIIMCVTQLRMQQLRICHALHSCQTQPVLFSLSRYRVSTFNASSSAASRSLSAVTSRTRS